MLAGHEQPVPADSLYQDRHEACGCAPHEQKLRSEQSYRRGYRAAAGKADLHRPVNRVKDALLVLVTVTVALPIDRPAFVALVDDELKLPRLRRAAPDHGYPASDSSSRAPERGDLGAEAGNVSWGQNYVKAHNLNLARTGTNAARTGSR